MIRRLGRQRPAGGRIRRGMIVGQADSDSDRADAGRRPGGRPVADARTRPEPGRGPFTSPGQKNWLVQNLLLGLDPDGMPTAAAAARPPTEPVGFFVTSSRAHAGLTYIT
jgi:hypothetical protein